MEFWSPHEQPEGMFSFIPCYRIEKYNITGGHDDLCYDRVFIYYRMTYNSYRMLRLYMNQRLK